MSCNKEDDESSTEIDEIEVTITNTETYEYNLGSFGDEEGVSIIVAPESSEINKLNRDKNTGHIIYTYKPTPNYIGNDYVELQGAYGSDGASANTNFTTTKITFIIEESEVEEMNFTGAIDACSDFNITKFLSSENTNTALRITGSGREQLNLTADFSTFEIPHNDITIEISEWDSSVADYSCNDVAPTTTPNKTESFTAISGTIKMKVSNIEILEFETYYNITLELENVIFENEEGIQKSISNLTIENIGVGWLPG